MAALGFGPASKGPGSEHLERADTAWRIVQAIGLALLVMGAFDLLLAWAPAEFGNADWEFGTASSTLNSMPVPAMGVALLAAASVQRESRLWLALSAGWSLVVVLGLLAVGVLYLLNLPMALRATEAEVPAGALQAAMAKAGLAFATYVTAHGYVILSCLRVLRRAS